MGSETASMLLSKQSVVVATRGSRLAAAVAVVAAIVAGEVEGSCAMGSPPGAALG